MYTNPSTLDKPRKLSFLLTASTRNKELTSFLCCSKRGGGLLLFIFLGLGVLVIISCLDLLRSLDDVEMAYRCDLPVRGSRTLRGFNFPPCLLDMVVVDDQVRDSDLPGFHAANHMHSCYQFASPPALKHPQLVLSSLCLKPMANRTTHNLAFCSWRTAVISGMKETAAARCPPGFLSAVIPYELLWEKGLVAVFL